MAPGFRRGADVGWICWEVGGGKNAHGPWDGFHRTGRGYRKVPGSERRQRVWHVGRVSGGAQEYPSPRSGLGM